MTRQYRLTNRARRDIAFVRAWYDAQDQPLGNDFLDELDAAFKLICERPMSFPLVAGDEVRATRCDRFPYRIYFVTLPVFVDILAVYHTSRDPERWDDANRD